SPVNRPSRPIRPEHPHGHIAFVSWTDTIASTLQGCREAMRALRLLTVLLVGAGLAAPALADEACPPAQEVTSVDIKLGDDGRIYIPFKVNGADRYMLVDTGGMFSELTRSAVNGLKLPQRRSRVELVGVGGDTTNMATHTTFTLGNLYSDGADFM